MDMTKALKRHKQVERVLGVGRGLGSTKGGGSLGEQGQEQAEGAAGKESGERKGETTQVSAKQDTRGRKATIDDRPESKTDRRVDKAQA